ncbi:MAG: zinc-binding dehydrogenase [Phycisphaerae bacterium]
MRAVRYHETGGPDVLRFEEAPTPKPGAGEVLLKVRAAALNRLDLFLRSGAAAMPGWSLPHIGGFDFAGEVVDAGQGVPKDRVGYEAMIKARVTGASTTGRLDILGIARPGGFAEYVAVPEECLSPKPSGFSWEEAAAYPCCHLTAYYGLIHCARLRPGETVLVHGGGSGAGSAACQVARLAGARVMTTVGSDAKKAKACELLNVDRAVNYRTEDVVACAQEFTGGRGVDVVFDPIWGRTAAQTIEALGRGGRWVLLGMIGGPTAELVATKILFKEITIRGIVEFFAADQQVKEAFALARQDRIRPIVSKVWPLEQLDDAQRQMESGDFFGKIVVTP